MLLFYASHDGHTRKIAERLCEVVALSGMAGRAVDLTEDFPESFAFPAAEPVVLLAPIRYGFHLPPARRFATRWKKEKPPAPLVVLSVNLTARKEGKNTPDGNAYLRKFLKKYDLKPALAAAIAGKLDYPRYGFFDRAMIRLIMAITGGPTDPSVTVDYTDWDKVEELGRKIADL